MLKIEPSNIISFQAFQVVLTSLAVFLTIGVYNIIKKVWMPGQLIMKEKPEELWGKGLIDFVKKQDAALSELGYSPYLTMSVVNLQSQNMMRIYRHPIDPAGIILNLISVSIEKETQCAAYAEITTRYLDGTMHTTINANSSSILLTPAYMIKQRFPGVADIAKLKTLHDKKAEEFSGRGHKFLRSEGQEKLMEEIQKYHSDFCALNESRGLLKYDKKTDLYRATVMSALWGIANFMNPLADNFTWPRFISGLVLGFCIPFIGTLFSVDVGNLLAVLTGMPAIQMCYVFLFVVFGLAGCVIGSIFKEKSFIWGFILGFIPGRVAASVFTGWFLLDLCMAMCADQVSRMLGRRENLF